MTQTRRRDVKVEMEANEIQLTLITFKEERPLPPSVKDSLSLLRFKLFFLRILMYFSFGSVCGLVIYLPLC